MNVDMMVITYICVLRIISEKRLTEFRDLFNYILVATGSKHAYLEKE